MAAAPWGPCLNGQGTGKGKYGDGDSFRGAPSFRGWDLSTRWDIGRHSLFPFPTVLWVLRKPPPTPLTCPQHRRSTGAAGRCLQIFLLCPQKVTFGALGQTGPTGKISQELI